MSLLDWQSTRAAALQRFAVPILDDRQTAAALRHALNLAAYKFVATASRGRDVLDWGCNDGYGLLQFAPFARSLAGVDTHRGLLRAARCRFSGAGVEADFAPCDVLAEPFPRRTFDLVTCFQLIEHISEYGLFVSNLIRKLADGGCLVISTPNAEFRLNAGEPPWNPFHYYEFTGAGLQSLLLEFFSRVDVLGLLASPSIIEAEHRRVDEARARYTPPNVVASQPSLLHCIGSGVMHYTETSTGEVIDWLALCSQPRRPHATR